MELVFVYKDGEDFEDLCTKDVVELASIDFKVKFRSLTFKKAENEFNIKENAFLPITFILKDNKVQSHILGDFDYLYLQNEILKHL